MIIFRNFSKLYGTDQNILDARIFWDFAMNTKYFFWNFQKMILEKFEKNSYTYLEARKIRSNSEFEKT